MGMWQTRAFGGSKKSIFSKEEREEHAEEIEHFSHDSILRKLLTKYTLQFS
jgi:hypothetical protein